MSLIPDRKKNRAESGLETEQGGGGENSQNALYTCVKY